MFDFHNLFQLPDPIHVTDIGAAAITEKPIYASLLTAGAAQLSTFDGDERQSEGISEAFGLRVKHYAEFLFDGTRQTAQITSPASGMSSLMKPRAAALSFFNGFTQFGAVEKTEEVQTATLDSIADLPAIDFLKMDVQGAELTILQHGVAKLTSCVALQLEVPFICLYDNQPGFGEIDVWLRSQGFLPHCFLDIKRWSIAPTIFNRNFRVPGNQLLEADIVYIKDPLAMDHFSDQQLKKLAVISDMCLNSNDLCVHMLRELQQRKLVEDGAVDLYLRACGRNPT